MKYAEARPYADPEVLACFDPQRPSLRMTVA
jgi:hypothetical protein